MSMTIQKSLRLPKESVQEIEDLASIGGKDFSSTVKDLLDEAIKSRRCPGIIFVDEPSGRRSRIAGTGIDVWELISNFKALKENYNELKKAYHWLKEPQIRAALSYYALYPKDIDERIFSNEEKTREQIIKRFPFLAKHR